MSPRLLLLIYTLFFTVPAHSGEIVETPYDDPKVVFDFYFDHPEKINSALFWVRSYMNAMSEAPYNYSPEFMDIKVIIHGTEIVTVVKKNYEKYKDTVERMKYYEQLGVEFRVCGLAARDYDYTTDDFQDFIKLAPSAMTELAYWQTQGYGLVTPKIMEKQLSIEEIR